MAGLLDVLAGAGAIGAGYNIANDVRGLGAQANKDLGELAGILNQQSQFKGYGVRTGMGQSSVDQYGNTDVGVGPDLGMQAAGGNMFGNAQNAFMNAYNMANAGGTNAWADPAYNMMNAGYNQMANAGADVAGREQSIYDRMMAMQQPGLDQQRAQQQAQEFAQGRSGIRGSQFGGTGEDAAMARAQAQAQNQAAVQAMGQAQTEMMNQANIGNQMFGAGAGMNQAGVGNAGLAQSGANIMNQLGAQQGGLGLQAYQTSYLPFQQQLNALQIGGQNADRYQTGQLTGTGYGAQLGLGGIQSQINAEKTAADLYANLFGAGMNAVSGASGMFSKMGEDPNASWWQKALSYL